MIFFFAVVQLAAADFVAQAYLCPLSQQLSVTIESDDNKVEGFLLSELYSSKMLQEAINDKYKVVSKKRRDNSPPHKQDDNAKDESYEQMRWSCRLAESYLKALKNIPYNKDEGAFSFEKKIFAQLKKKKVDHECYPVTPGSPLLVMHLKLDYDLELLKLIMKMCHNLLLGNKMIISPKKLLTIFDIYEDLRFYNNSVVDVFSHDLKSKTTSHLLIDSSVLFGINLYVLLKNSNLLEEFNTKVFVKKVGREVDPIYGEIKDIIEYKRLNFLEPMFRLIKIRDSSEQGKSCINFIDALVDMRYKWEHGDQLSLYTQECTSGTKPISFLEVCNGGANFSNRISRLIAIVPEVRIPNIAQVFGDILDFLPKIKELNLLSSGCTRYENEHYIRALEYDTILFSLLDEHKKNMSKLTGLVMIGYISLSKKTIMWLQTYAFEKFGMHGACFGEDTNILISIFEKDINAQSQENVKCLSNSVTHFLAAEDLVEFAVKNSIIKNLQKSTVYQHWNKNPSNAMTDELQLKTLQVLAEPDILEEYIIALREQYAPNSTKPRCIELNNKPLYSVSTLVLLSSPSYKWNWDTMQSCAQYALYFDTLEITLTMDFINNIDVFLYQLPKLNCWNKNMVLNLSGDLFIYQSERSGRIKLHEYTINLMYRIYRLYFDNEIQNKLTFRISSQMHDLEDSKKNIAKTKAKRERRKAEMKEEEVQNIKKAKIEKEAQIPKKPKIEEEALILKKPKIEEEALILKNPKIEEDEMLAEMEEEALILKKPKIEEEAQIPKKPKIEEDEFLAAIKKVKDIFDEMEKIDEVSALIEKRDEMLAAMEKVDEIIAAKEKDDEKLAYMKKDDEKAKKAKMEEDEWLAKMEEDEILAEMEIVDKSFAEIKKIDAILALMKKVDENLAEMKEEAKMRKIDRKDIVDAILAEMKKDDEELAEMKKNYEKAKKAKIEEDEWLARMEEEAAKMRLINVEDIVDGTLFDFDKQVFELILMSRRFTFTVADKERWCEKVSYEVSSQ
ncbi:hypothetical protein ENBRE01_2709 [Enteropsectra breve]|nr:hypothetical protein ENBRE01_2709 [Enteropsectra breve]